jgi:enolase-phosphatase E1
VTRNRGAILVTCHSVTCHIIRFAASRGQSGFKQKVTDVPAVQRQTHSARRRRHHVTRPVRLRHHVPVSYVRARLRRFLDHQWTDPEVAQARELIAHDAGAKTFSDWAGSDRTKALEKTCAEVLRLMEGDVKATGLKTLQGLIWREGFLSAEMRAEVFDDVPVALKLWNQRGLDVRIYSSGSIEAQRLFFGHTTAGNLLPLLKGHYDTTSGPKKIGESYRKIANAIGTMPDHILFLSDVAGELDAAKEAGMRTALVIRPGNARTAAGHGHAEIQSFAEIQIA